MFLVRRPYWTYSFDLYIYWFIFHIYKIFTTKISEKNLRFFLLRWVLFPTKKLSHSMRYIIVLLNNHRCISVCIRYLTWISSFLVFNDFHLKFRTVHTIRFSIGVDGSEFSQYFRSMVKTSCMRISISIDPLNFLWWKSKTVLSLFTEH